MPWPTSFRPGEAAGDRELGVGAGQLTAKVLELAGQPWMDISQPLEVAVARHGLAEQHAPSLLEQFYRASQLAGADGRGSRFGADARDAAQAVLAIPATQLLRHELGQLLYGLFRGPERLAVVAEQPVGTDERRRP